ncbi:hypothetical protein EOA19_15575 [Mesorhizobium sp. M7A.F.Ca.US.010.02.1.1]|nr:hypothetical protein EOA19_15575 [Mesorhizobium sp. M7A.F.Ca.US.010.02.1.1]
MVGHGELGRQDQCRRDSTPLWPAGHLPRKEGDWLSSRLSLIANVARRALRVKLSISPLAGEMSGRTEGGVKDLGVTGIAFIP